MVTRSWGRVTCCDDCRRRWGIFMGLARRSAETQLIVFAPCVDATDAVQLRRSWRACSSQSEVVSGCMFKCPSQDGLMIRGMDTFRERRLVFISRENAATNCRSGSSIMNATYCEVWARQHGAYGGALPQVMSDKQLEGYGCDIFRYRRRVDPKKRRGCGQNWVFLLFVQGAFKQRGSTQAAESESE